MILAIDPGPTRSAFVRLDGDLVIEHGDEIENDDLLGRLIHAWRGALVVEKIESYGKPVGAEVFTTVLWCGRFIQAWRGTSWALVSRREIKLALCNASNAKDPDVRQALIDRYGPGRAAALGTKKQPGPLYGIAGHRWAALAVGVAYYMMEVGEWKPRSSAAAARP